MTPDAATRARRACRDRYGAPSVVASAPGRVNLVGGHTDYNDGLVLPVAIDRRTAVAARPREDRTVRVHSTDVGETATFPLDAPDEVDPRWAAYPAGVAWALGDVATPLVGADLVVAGDVPQGAGLASSAALEVATAFALVGVAGGDPTAARRSLATRCRRAENEFVGVDCGILDQFAAALCERDAALFLDCRTGETDLVPLARDAALLVVDTNVTHSLADSAYNERRRECERGVDLLAERIAGVEALRDVSSPAFERHADALPEPVRSRCRHVVSETERVRAAAAALRAGDLARVGALMDASHVGLREDYAVCCRELDLLVDLFDREAVYGARMTGGGFGGSVVALVEARAVESVADAVTAAYERETGTVADAYRCAASAGARLD